MSNPSFGENNKIINLSYWVLSAEFAHSAVNKKCIVHVYNMANIKWSNDLFFNFSIKVASQLTYKMPKLKDSQSGS